MYNIERKTEIIRQLEEEGKVSVLELSEQFNTSRETIRRDLKDLESQGVLTRTHGGAVANHVLSSDGKKVVKEYPVDVRHIRNLKEKQAICKAAAMQIANDDVVFVDNSSTCLSLLQYLPDDLHVTFVTNSIKFLTESEKYTEKNVTIYCLGGLYNPKNLSTYDTVHASVGAGFYPNKCFISCNGISPERMITDGSIYEVQTKKQMMDASQEVYLLADHTKFNQEGQYFLSDGNELQYLITDAAFEQKRFPFFADVEIIVANE